ncbi:unnamed protein product [Rotaria sordida]|uniref:HAT C-terminal dimerisation domain-containing protein n=1 Tax=Rotaria sordida TaxID=392033 RepID=A0A819UC14_9BILA|nr:unnamed protein product [Rotaria sordida]
MLLHILNDQIPNPSSTSAATQTVLSETSNLLSTVGSSGSVDADSIPTYDHFVLKSSSPKISSLSSTSLTPIITSSLSINTSLPDPSLQLVSSSIPSSPLPIDNHCSIADQLSQPVSPSISLTSSTSPSLLPIDSCRSSTDPLSQPVSPSSPLSFLASLDISRSSADPPTQPMLPSYKINNENRSFRNQWIANRPAAHLTAVSNYNEFVIREKSKLTVINVADHGRVEQIRRNRERLIKIASAILLCERQMIPLRGHLEHAESSCQTDLVVKSIFNDSTSNATCLSPFIQNELLHLMGHQIRCRISEKLKNKSYALLAAESRDVAGHQQMSVVLRVIDDEKTKSTNYFIQEFLLGLIALHSLDTRSLANAIVEILKKYNIDLNLLIALCFDGASIMGGKNAGVQAILREKFMPKASYIHCHVHRLNLVIVDVCVSISYVSEFYSVIKKIHNYFTASSVTNERFRDAQNQLKLVHTNLKLWAHIRWDSRWTSIDAILKNYQVIILAFDDLIKDGGDRAVDLLGPIKILSDKSKAKTLDYGKAQQLILSIIEELTLSRDEKSFEQLFQTIAIFCKQNSINLNDRPRQHRKRAVSIRFKDSIIISTVGQRDDSLNEQYYKTHIYYQLIDNILVELKDRFSSKNLHILSSVSSLCPDSDTFLHFDSLKPFADHLNFDRGVLSNELVVVKPMLQKKSLATIIDLYQELYPFRQAFPTLVALIESAITIPVSSTTCERTFSKMKLIKTTVRNTMSDDRLSDLCLLAVERDIDVNFEELIDKFSDIHKNSRIMLK